MEIIKYLESQSGTPEAILEKLQEELGIKHSISTEYNLVVLNYCQIESPKHHPITIECRSLVLAMPTYSHAAPAGPISGWKVVSRSFDRFFNYGEVADVGWNAPALSFAEKRDGSLIGLFFYNGEWLWRTRSMIMPTSSVNGWDITWDELIREALGREWFELAEAHKDNDDDIDRDYTFIMEVTAPENRVVTKYAEREMTLLACRHNEDGHYFPREKMHMQHLKWRLPELEKFDTMADAVASASSLRELKEGYVVYNRHGEPVGKVKNPAYVAAHHIRGEENINYKRAMDLVIMREQDEFLAIFPEYKPMFIPFIEAYQAMLLDVARITEQTKGIEDQKEFALAVKDSPVAPILFQVRQGRKAIDSWNGMRKNARYKVLHGYLATKKVLTKKGGDLTGNPEGTEIVYSSWKPCCEDETTFTIPSEGIDTTTLAAQVFLRPEHYKEIYYVKNA